MNLIVPNRSIDTMNTPPMIPTVGALARRVLKAALLAMALVAAGPAARAADFNPPDFLTYQGFLADSNGVGLAPTNPINYDVVFRIYDAQTGGNLVWAERQTVTVDKGVFSVLLGEGSANASEPRPVLYSVFGSPTASDRFLDLTVTVGTSPLNIAPRLRLVTSPYAFHSRTASALAGSNGAPALTAVNGQVNINNAALNIVSSASTGVETASFRATGINGGAWDSLIHWGPTGDIYWRSAHPAGKVILQDTGGTVGIGTGTPGFPLTFANTLGDKISLWGQSGASIGFGVQANLMQIHTLAPSDDIAFGYGSSGAMTETMRIKGNGRVGIGTTGPDAYLTVVSHSNSGGNNTAVFTPAGLGGPSSHLHYGPTGDIYWRSAHPSGRVILQDTGGNVGIGTGGPLDKLDVAGIGRFSGAVQIGAGAASGLYGDGGNVAVRTYPGGGIYFQSAGGAATPLYIGPDNNSVFHGSLHVDGNSTIGARVGIGGGDINLAQLAVNGGPLRNGLVGPYLNIGAHGPVVAHGGHLISIYASHGVWTGDFFVVASDERIKTVESKSDAAGDLALLRGIEITNYRYKDVLGRGDALHKKVIAQQVEKVYPQAVRKETDAVPDIYKPAPVKDGWVSLATDLKKGERVRLISAKNEQSIHEVLEVTAEGFRTDYKREGDQVFVFGREVKDFRVVDYDAIAMLNVSATQELAKQVEALRKSEARVAELEKKASRVEGLERDVAELKRLVAQLAAVRQPVPVIDGNESETVALSANR